MNRVNIVALAVFLLATALLLALSPQNSSRIGSTVLNFAAPLLKSGSALRTQTESYARGLETVEKLEQSNSTLQVENRRLAAENQILRDIKSENDRLRTLLEFRQRTLFSLVPAEVIADDTRTWWNTCKISIGSNAGIRDNLPVITSSGLVGKTVLTSGDISTVLLLTDETCGVPALVEGTSIRGIVQGLRASVEDSQELSMNFLDRKTVVQPGQRVVTSGQGGGLYPPGILIGEITRFEQQPLSGRAVLKSSVDFRNLDTLFIVTGPRATPTAQTAPAPAP